MQPTCDGDAIENKIPVDSHVENEVENKVNRKISRNTHTVEFLTTECIWGWKRSSTDNKHSLGGQEWLSAPFFLITGHQQNSLPNSNPQVLPALTMLLLFILLGLALLLLMLFAYEDATER